MTGCCARPLVTCSTALAVAVATAACLPVAGPVRIPTPVLAEGRLTIPALDAGAPPLALAGPWVSHGDRHCVAGETVGLVTAAGVIPFDDAHLCVTLSPVSIDGEATVALPALGFLAQAGLEVEGRRARVRFAPGSQLGALDLGGHRLRVNPRHYYLVLELAEGFRARFGKASLATPGGAVTMVIDPQEPLVYVAGQLSLPGLSADGAFGFSPAGRLGARPAVALPGAPALSGHILAAASVPLPSLPITIRGELVIDLDADDDGVTVLDGDDGDLALLGNGAISIGYGRQGHDLAIEVGSGSLHFDARAGAVVVAGVTGGLFDGTPLAALAPARGTLTGHFRGPDDFALAIAGETSVLGFAAQQVRLALDPRGVRARLRLVLAAGMGAVDLEGEASAAGFALRGRADLTVAGLRLLGAHVELGRAGVTVRGTLVLPGLGQVAVSGAVSARGQVALSGTGTLSPFGLRLAGARVALSERGAAIDGHVDFLGSRFAVRGTASGRTLALAGALRVDLAVFKGETALAITQAGVRARIHGRACVGPACLDLAGLDLDSAGKVCPVFPVVGRRCLKIL